MKELLIHQVVIVLMRHPLIQNIHHIPLSDQEREVFLQILASHKRLVIKSEFEKGFGGCRVFAQAKGLGDSRRIFAFAQRQIISGSHANAHEH